MLVVYTVHRFFVTHTHMQVFEKVPYKANGIPFVRNNESVDVKVTTKVLLPALTSQKLCASTCSDRHPPFVMSQRELIELPAWCRLFAPPISNTTDGHDLRPKCRFQQGAKIWAIKIPGKIIHLSLRLKINLEYMGPLTLHSQVIHRPNLRDWEVNCRLVVRYQLGEELETKRMRTDPPRDWGRYF